MDTALEGLVPSEELPPTTRTFGTVFREAARATWGSRLRWVWTVLGLAAVAYAVLTPDLGLDSWGFAAACTLASWIPAWLGADLLAIRFRANPEPLRSWAPWEFLARASGRLLPFLAAQTLWLGVFTARSLAERMMQGGAAQMVDPLNGVSTQNIAGWCIAWVAVFHASGLPSFAVAAVMSTTARRPRPLVITPMVAILTPAALLAALQAVTSTPMFSPFPRGSDPLGLLSHWTFGGANLWVGISSVALLEQVLKSVTTRTLIGDFSGLCWYAALMFVLYAIPPLCLTAWIAARRWRSSHGSRERAGRQRSEVEGSSFGVRG